MNLHHLRYFLAVTRTGGFTSAARSLHVTQPTVSTGVSELESSLGVRLFNRDSRRVDLTIEGRTLMAYAVQIEELLEEARERLHRPDTLQDEGFRFGAIDAAVIYLLPDILREYMGAFPLIELSAQVAPSRYLVEDLLKNRSEFALISLPFTHPKIETLSLVTDEMPLVVGADHAFAQRSRVRPEELGAEAMILFPEGSVSRKIVDERLAETGVSPRVVMVMRSPEAMRKLVEAGVGVSFLPRMTVAESLESGLLAEVAVTGVRFSREIGVAWRRGRYFGPAIRHLLDAIFQRFDRFDEWRERSS